MIVENNGVYFFTTPQGEKPEYSESKRALDKIGQELTVEITRTP